MGKKAVVGIVDFKGEIILGKKKDTGGFLSGKWHIPGETLENGEDFESGLLRGMKEEIGVDIVVLRYLASYKTLKGTDVRWYECRLKNASDYDNINAGSDLECVVWAPKARVMESFGDLKEIVSLWPDEVKGYFGL